MEDDLDAKHALAFGINLESQLGLSIVRSYVGFSTATSHWADLLLGWRYLGRRLVTQDGFDRFEVQRHATAVNQGLKNLVHVPADLEIKVAAILHLIDGVLETKSAALLLLQIERETQAGGINPTLAVPDSTAL